MKASTKLFIARVGFLVAVSLGILTPSANALSAENRACGPTVRRIATVIGVNQYAGEPLQNAVRDAELVGSALKEIGFEVVVHHDLDQKGVRDALAQFEKRVATLCDTDLPLFYFAGRGAEIRRMGYMFPTDFDVVKYYGDPSRTEKDLLPKAVAMKEVYAAFGRFAGPKLILFDTCRVDPIQGRSSDFDPLFAVETRMPDNTLISYATEPNTFAQDGPPGGNGPFAVALAEALRAEAKPIEVLLRNVKNTVGERTKGKQAPFADNNLISDVSLGARPAKGQTPGVLRKARTAQGSERKVALVIGVADYTSPFINKLNNPLRDAAGISAALRRLGFEVIEKRNPNQEDLISSLTDFSETAAGADWALIYYAGHSVELDGTTLLIPVDARFLRDIDVADETYSLSKLLSKLKYVKTLPIVILDSCRDNPFSDEARIRFTNFRGELSTQFGRPPANDAVFVAYSTRQGSRASDGRPGGSPFATAILGLIEQPRLEVGMLFRKVRDEVVKSTNGQQVPFTYGSLPARDFFFKR